MAAITIRGGSKFSGGMSLQSFTSSALTPAYGTSFTSTSNSSRTINIPPHWSRTQPFPNISVAAGNYVGNGSSCTATVATDPTSGNPRMYVGGYAQSLNMSDATANANGMLITALTATTVVHNCSYNGTTGGGTIAADKMQIPALGTGYNDFQYGTPLTRIEDRTLYGGGQTMIRTHYGSVKAVSINHKYFLAVTNSNGYGIGYCATPDGNTLQTCSTIAYACKGTISSEGNDAVWSKITPEIIYFQESTGILKKITFDPVTHTCSAKTTVKDFSASYSNLHVGGGEGDARPYSNGTEDILPMLGYIDSTHYDAFTYRPQSDTKVTILANRNPAGNGGYNDWGEVDNIRVFRNGDTIIDFNPTGTADCFHGIVSYPASGGCTQLEAQNLHGEVIDASDGNRYFIGDNSAGTGPAGCENGLMRYSQSGTRTCLWNRATAKYDGGNAWNTAGHISGEGDWILYDLTDTGCDGVNCTADGNTILSGDVLDSQIAPNWKNIWNRNSEELIVIKYDASSSYRMNVFYNEGSNNARNDGYNRSPFASLFPLLSTDNAQSVPAYYIFNMNMRDGSVSSFGSPPTDIYIGRIR